MRFLERFPAINQHINHVGAWGTYISIVWAVMSWVASQVPSFAGYGWATFVFIGLGAACALSLVLSAALVAWRYFNPLPPKPPIGTSTLPPQSLGRISLIEFMRIAERQGWRLSGEQNLEGVDLLEGLQQAGSYGTIQFWGRLNRYGNRTLIDMEVFVPISQEHWHNYKFNWTAVLSAVENMETETYNLHNTNQAYVGGYVDILMESDAATAWLASEALEFKGRRDRLDRAKRSKL